MEARKVNKLMVVAGSFLMSNGALLLFTPGRFATLRHMTWMPQQYNKVIDRLAVDRTKSRAAGIGALLLGLGLLTAGVGRTEPST